MKIVKIVYRTEAHPEGKIIAVLGWDEKQKKIVVVSGKRSCLEWFFEEPSFLHKGTMKRIKASHSLKFFKAIPYVLAGSYVWASLIKEKPIRK